MLVDLDGPGDPPAPVAPGYAGVRMFGLRHGRPVADLRVPADADPAEVLARLRAVPAEPPPPPLDDADLPAATVVVPTTFARTATLRRCLDALTALDYPRVEILLVDNRPAAAGQPIEWAELAALPGVRVLAEPAPGASAARNRGLAEATGEVVAFTDDDVIVDRRWLRALAGRLVQEPGADAVTGLVLPQELETAAQVWFEQSGSNFAQRYARGTFRLGPGRFQLLDERRPGRPPSSLYALGELGTGANLAFRTAALRRLRGFDTALGPGTPARAGEDLLLFVRLLTGGGRLAFEPAAFVHHRHRRSHAELREQLHGYGVGFSAMLTAAVLGEPRHLLGILRVLGPALGRAVRGTGERTAPRPVAYPSDLHRAELRGLAFGPIAYLHSRRTMRAWRR